MKAMSEWYIQAFGEFYPILYPHRDDSSADREIKQLIKVLNLTGDEQILDICCGTGRHLSALVARSFNAWGTDLSMALLKKASNHPATAGRIINAEMRSLPFKSCFDVVFNLFTSFGYFLEDSQNMAALKEMVALLRPGGLLVLDHINRYNLQRNLIKENQQQRGEWEVLQKRRIEKNRVIKEITLISGDGSATCLTENVRLFYPDEIKRLFQTSGLKDVRFFGSFKGTPLKKNTERMITVGTKEKE